MTVPLVIFDGDCAFCTSCVTWAQRYVAPRAVWRPWQSSDLPALGLTVTQCERALQWVDLNSDPDSGSPSHAEGGRAVRLILKQGRMPWPVIAVLLGLPGIRALVDWAYRVVARHRHRLPGATPACALPLADPAQPPRRRPVSS